MRPRWRRWRRARCWWTRRGRRAPRRARRRRPRRRRRRRCRRRRRRRPQRRPPPPRLRCRRGRRCLPQARAACLGVSRSSGPGAPGGCLMSRGSAHANGFRPPGLGALHVLHWKVVPTGIMACPCVAPAVPPPRASDAMPAGERSVRVPNTRAHLPRLAQIARLAPPLVRRRCRPEGPAPRASARARPCRGNACLPPPAFLTVI